MKVRNITDSNNATIQGVAAIHKSTVLLVFDWIPRPEVNETDNNIQSASKS